MGQGQSPPSAVPPGLEGPSPSAAIAGGDPSPTPGSPNSAQARPQLLGAGGRRGWAQAVCRRRRPLNCATIFAGMNVYLQVRVSFRDEEGRGAGWALSRDAWARGMARGLGPGHPLLEEDPTTSAAESVSRTKTLTSQTLQGGRERQRRWPDFPRKVMRNVEETAGGVGTVEGARIRLKQDD